MQCKNLSGGVKLKKSKYEIDMCNGSIMDKLISFSLPLMLSSILQLMFNAVDIIVVGRFSGSQALAAVGSTTALINIFTNLFIGISQCPGGEVFCGRTRERNVGGSTYGEHAGADQRSHHGVRRSGGLQAGPAAHGYAG